MKKIRYSSLLLIISMSAFFSSLKAERSPQIPPNPEFDLAITLTPNYENGKKLYGNCIVCHGPEGWGTPSGNYPQIAGQIRSVIIKQLADFRAGNRDNPIMRAFSSRRALGSAQDIADVAEYIARLPMTTENGQGPELAVRDGEEIYKRDCVDCHGNLGQGVAEDHSPMLQGQHFNYLMRQFEWIRVGKRRNADRKMTKQIGHFTFQEELAVLSYVSRLKPPAEKLAPAGWVNPDFPRFVRIGDHQNVNK
jgi:cytochrome c553